MKSKISLFILFLIFVFSSISIFLLYSYLDPERNLIVSFAIMGTAILLAGTAIGSIILYSIKRIYYRGIVDSGILHSSIRQSFLLCLGGLGLLIFHKIGILTWRTGGLIFFILLLFELMIESLSDE